MTPEPAFRAPWSRSLVLTSIAVTVLFLTCALIPLLANLDGVSVSVAALLLALWVGAALFTVRGYVLSGDALLVQRLLWRTALPLGGLIGAAADPAAMHGARRLAGNGGLFSFSGLWTNRRLGRFRTFATSPRLAVVLELREQKVVVTPENPGAFLDTLRLRFPRAMISEVREQAPGVRFYDDVGDEYEHLSHVPSDNCVGCEGEGTRLSDRKSGADEGSSVVH